MAYNLRPLIQILEHILNPQQNRRPHWALNPRRKPLIESLLTKASFLNELFENPSLLAGHEVGSLESRIRDAAHHAQSVIENHLADRLLTTVPNNTITISPPYSLQVIGDLEFEPIYDKLVNIMDGRDTRTGPLSSDLVSSSEDLNPKNIIVGLSDAVLQLKEKLFTQKSKLEIIPIVGMGGIGKTTLARTLYDDEYAASYFDIRAWVVISQSYTEREILFGLLKCINGNQDGNNDLGLQLYQNLCGRRYLIVLDDMWSFDAWDSIRNYFPDNNQRSRILVTTRNQDVAHSVASSEHLHHKMKLLNEAESWELLLQKISSKGSRGLQLEDIGKNIAKDCSGLPLAIHVVGGVLSSLDPTEEAWKQVAKDISSINDGQILETLSLSYNYLPNHLKPCFLYLGAFPEDCQIQGSRLIKLWMAEGFLKPISGMSFEDAAKVYLNQLVERNLLSVGRQETKGRVKSYIMHDLIRDLCCSKAQKEKFLYGVTDAINDLNLDEVLQLRLRVHASYEQVTQIIESPGFPDLVCSLLLFGNTGVPDELSWLRKYAFGLRLLKVLDMLEVKKFEELPEEMERLINLRYLAVCISNLYPGSISNLSNLQTLIFHLKYRDSFVGKVKELLDIPQLRHIKFKGYMYPLLVLEDGESLDAVNEQLQTLSTVAVGDSFDRVLKAAPNLKKLGIDFASVSSSSSTIDLRLLFQLQVLKCSRLSRWSISLIFPPALQKLTLHEFNIPNGFLKDIGGLPNLKVLKAKHCHLSEDYMGEWEPTKGEFKELRLLLLESFSNLKKWIADETHYPKLEHLIIYNCYKLEEIPSEIGYIPTLEIIEVRSSSICVENSARKIQEEQIEEGNDTLHVLIIGESKELLRIAAALKEAKTTLREEAAKLTVAIMDFYWDMVVSNRVLKAGGTLMEATTMLRALMVGKREATVEVELAMAQLLKARTSFSHAKTEAQGMYACYEAVTKVNAIERVIAVVVGVTCRQALIILREAMITNSVSKAEIVAEAEAALVEGEKILAELTEAYMGKDVTAKLEKTLTEDYPMERLVLINVAENEKRLQGFTEAETKVAKAKAALVVAEKIWMKSTVVEAEETLTEVVEEALRAEKEARAEKEKEAGKPNWALIRTTTAAMVKNNKAKVEKTIVNLRKMRANTTEIQANATEIEVHTRLAEAATSIREAYEAEQITIEKMKAAKEKEHKVMVGINATGVEVKTALFEASTAVEKTNKALEMSRAKAVEAYTAVAKAKKALEMAIAKAEESSTAVAKAKKALKMARAKDVEIATAAVGDNFHRVLKANPNLKKLGIDFASLPSHSSTINLSSLYDLQVLKISWLSRWSFNRRFLPPLQMFSMRDWWYVMLPHSLQKLTLHDFNIPSWYLNAIGGLPNLQVFKVTHCRLSQDSMGEWEAAKGEFKELRLLVLENFKNLKNWIADKTHYPKLEHLMIYDCNDLEEIPNEIGYIPTIERIEVRNSSISVQKSVRKIQVEKAERGNDTLQALIISEPKLEEIPKIPKGTRYTPTPELIGLCNSSISVEKSAREIQEEQQIGGGSDTLHVLIGNIFESGVERE